MDAITDFKTYWDMISAYIMLPFQIVTSDSRTVVVFGLFLIPLFLGLISFLIRFIFKIKNK